MKHRELVAHDLREEPQVAGRPDSLGSTIILVSAAERGCCDDSWVEFRFKRLQMNALQLLLEANTGVPDIVDRGRFLLRL
jgi:hypothetical protein